jgi:hypothetical protein
MAFPWQNRKRLKLMDAKLTLPFLILEASKKGTMKMYSSLFGAGDFMRTEFFQENILQI